MADNAVALPGDAACDDPMAPDAHHSGEEDEVFSIPALPARFFSNAAQRRRSACPAAERDRLPFAAAPCPSSLPFRAQPGVGAGITLRI
jgi:hypothetical protein